MEHTYQDVGFHHSAFPFSGSTLNNLISPKNRRFNIGGLVEYLLGEIRRSPKVKSVRSHFSLLNVVNNFNKFSCGYSAIPPDDAIPANSHIVFTFSLSDEDYDNYDVVPDVQVNISNNISVWGYGEFQFLSIGMTSVTATNLGLSAMFHFDTQYLYNIVGAITKNISNFNQFDMFNRPVVYTKPLHLYADQYLHRSLRNLFETVPYANWIFSDAIWRLAPNVFNARQVTGDVAEYYFRNCSRAVRNVAQNDGSRETIFGLNVQAKSGITGHLRSSILSFMQNVKTDEYVFDEDSDYLAPLVILAMIETRSNVITGSREDATKVLEAFSERSVTWETILSNPTQVAERMIANDTRLADALLGIVDFEE